MARARKIINEPNIDEQENEVNELVVELCNTCGTVLSLYWKLLGDCNEIVDEPTDKIKIMHERFELSKWQDRINHLRYKAALAHLYQRKIENIPELLPELKDAEAWLKDIDFRMGETFASL